MIDDDATVRELVVKMLERDQYEFIEAHNGDAGVAVASEQSLDLILCDCTMPGITGLQVLETLRANETTASIPFVFLTATDDAATRRRADELGAEAFMGKPIGIGALRELVANVLQREDTNPPSSP